jgi:hypothetical protein
MHYALAYADALPGRSTNAEAVWPSFAVLAVLALTAVAAASVSRAFGSRLKAARSSGVSRLKAARR